METIDQQIGKVDGLEALDCFEVTQIVGGGVWAIPFGVKAAAFLIGLGVVGGAVAGAYQANDDSSEWGFCPA